MYATSAALSFRVLHFLILKGTLAPLLFAAFLMFVSPLMLGARTFVRGGFVPMRKFCAFLLMFFSVITTIALKNTRDENVIMIIYYFSFVHD